MHIAGRCLTSYLAEFEYHCALTCEPKFCDMFRFPLNGKPGFVSRDIDFTDLPLTNSCGIRLDVFTVGECQYIVSQYVNTSHLHAYAEQHIYNVT